MFVKIGRVLSKLNFAIPEDLLQGAANGKPGVIEFILITLRSKVANSIVQGPNYSILCYFRLSIIYKLKWQRMIFQMKTYTFVLIPWKAILLTRW